MGERSHLARAKPVAHLVVLTLFAALPCAPQAQQPGSSSAALARPDQDAYLEDLIRSAPKDWAHGRSWVLITPYVLGRNVTEPSAKTLCPDDVELAIARSVGSDVAPWIYSSPEPCNQLAATHDSAVIVLEDRKDRDAAYFLFLACDIKRSHNHCDIDLYDTRGTMKLEESDHGSQRQFEVLAPNTDDGISRFSVVEVWHLRNPLQEPSAK
jgi:hypothetical protein